MMAEFKIPPVFVEAEAAPPPPQSAFRKRPAEQIAVGDMVVLLGQVYRVKARRTSQTSPRITFVLYPCAGGRPTRQSYFPRNWLDVARGF